MVWVSDDFPESLHIVSDAKTGLNGVIAIHSTAIGPAAGGCRFWNYGDQQALVTDAIRLARGMSYKNALAGLSFGGGKAVLQRSNDRYDREALFKAFGKSVNELGGAYVTAKDVGTGIADMQTVRTQTRFVAGLDDGGHAAVGDPSLWTARGVFESIQAAALTLNLQLNRAKIAVQGAGNVASHLCRLLANAGAQLIIADVDEARAHALAMELGAAQIGADEILRAEANILVPCALGAVLDDLTIPALRVELVCGAANNQLAEDRHGDMLRRHGILYAPDYVVNAGGIINVCAEYLGESVSHAQARVAGIAPRLLDIIRRAHEHGIATNQVADELARNTIAATRRLAA